MTTAKNRTCCIIGRRNLQKGYEPTIEFELETLLAHGINCFFFCGLAPFEQACLRTLLTLHRRHNYIPFQTIFVTDVFRADEYRICFDRVIGLYHEDNAPDFDFRRYIIDQSHYMVYFSKSHDYGGSYPAVRYGFDNGLRPINIAARKKLNDAP